MIDKNLLRDVLIGITAGWAVIIFSDSYNEVKELILEMFNDNLIASFIIEVSLPLIFLLIMFLLAVIALRFRSIMSKRIR